ncbi:hypothetical protein PF005_g15573 [Phytophthora fragariae]|uniref:DDE Tnp4 domain-containing protein n=2 Tax=Phytophthora TaxID=4783 RepID=A0A6A3TQ82_9STRA|nr:hypothetical protein PF003_g2566 [Phytophthora fragariae]KAE8992921.1 hypothetical protein PR001_g20809 [Phytophthora rubi]KAE8928819.1 hypothetical protein PF009_g21050 [Phytophthora fragariae]KAE8978263.1 hypothetical protein PF011_g23321 [Phytophthora fragariae]KAE8998236.1 hypothetical protein PR002_g18791 [Phytophthora rubi]
MPSPPLVAVLALNTAAFSVALACAFMMRRNMRVNVCTIDASIDFESLMHDSCYDAWFKRHLRCSQKTFHLLCAMLRRYFPVVPYKKYSFERAVACTLYHLGSSGGFRETALALGVSKAWCIVNVNAVIRVLFLMRAECIKLPTSQAEWEIISDGFRQI